MFLGSRNVYSCARTVAKVALPPGNFSGLQKGPAERGHVKNRQKDLLTLLQAPIFRPLLGGSDNCLHPPMSTEKRPFLDLVSRPRGRGRPLFADNWTTFESLPTLQGNAAGGSGETSGQGQEHLVRPRNPGEPALAPIPKRGRPCARMPPE